MKEIKQRLEEEKQQNLTQIKELKAELNSFKLSRNLGNDLKDLMDITGGDDFAKV